MVTINVNVLFTAIPIVILGLFEQRTSIPELEKNSYYYRTIKQNSLLRTSEFAKWNFSGCFHALICYFFAYLFVYRFNALFSDGKVNIYIFNNKKI